MGFTASEYEDNAEIIEELKEYRQDGKLDLDAQELDDFLYVRGYKGGKRELVEAVLIGS